MIDKGDLFLGGILIVAGGSMALTGDAFAKGLIPVHGLHVRVVGLVFVLFGAFFLYRSRRK